MSSQFTASPLALTSLVVEMLKSCFEQEGNFLYKRGDPVNSTVSILEKNQLKLDEVQKRPAIIASRGPIGVVRHSIGDFKSLNPNGTQDLSILLDGSYTIMCVATNAVEVETLAEEVLGCLLCFQTIIARDWDFIKFRAINIGEVQQIEEYKENFVLPLSFTYQVERTWGIRQVSPILKKIDATVRNLSC